jgi:hypothetical protein
MMTRPELSILSGYGERLIWRNMNKLSMAWAGPYIGLSGAIAEADFTDFTEMHWRV